MSEENSKAKPVVKLEPLNEEIMKGIWVDGFGIGLSADYVILDGIITPPRSNKPCVVARLLIPPRMLGQLAKNFSVAAERQKQLKPPEIEVKTEP